MSRPAAIPSGAQPVMFHGCIVGDIVHDAPRCNRIDQARLRLTEIQKLIRLRPREPVDTDDGDAYVIAGRRPHPGYR